MRIRLLLLAVAALTASGCVSEPPAVVVPGGRSASSFLFKHVVRDTADAQKRADGKLDGLLQRVTQMAGLDRGVFQTSFVDFTTDYQQCESEVAAARQLLGQMNATSSNVPAEARQQLAQASAAMQSSQAALERVLGRFRVDLAYLKQNFNATGVTSMRSKAQSLRADVKRLHAQVDRSSAAAAALVRVL